MAIGIGIGLPFRRTTTPAVPSGLSASFTVDTISGDLTWTDNTGEVAQYEIYSSYNGNSYVYLGTTTAGATSYSDTTCKQNASVVYKIRAKYYSLYSEYITSSVVITPLCWKTDQADRIDVVINSLKIASEKTVTINWGDGTSNSYTGSNTNITKSYSASEVNVFNIAISGDVNFITEFQHYTQLKSYGNITNWLLPSSMILFNIQTTGFTSDISGWVLPSTLRYFYVNSTQVSVAIS